MTFSKRVLQFMKMTALCRTLEEKNLIRHQVHQKLLVLRALDEESLLKKKTHNSLNLLKNLTRKQRKGKQQCCINCKLISM